MWIIGFLIIFALIAWISDGVDEWLDERQHRQAKLNAYYQQNPPND